MHPFRGIHRARPALLVLGIAVALVAVLLVLGIVAARLLISEDRVGEQLAVAVRNGTDGLYALRIDDLDIQPLRGRVAARGVRLSPDSTELARLEATGDLPATRGVVEVDRLALHGVDRWRLLRHRRLDAGELRARGWSITLSGDARSDAARPAERSPGAAVDTAVGEDQSLMERWAEDLPAGETPLRLDRIRLSGGTLIRSAGEGSGTVASGVTLEADDVQLDEGAALDTTRVLFARRLLLSVDEVRRPDSDGMHELSLGPIRLSTEDSSLRIDSLRYAATLAAAEFQRRVRQRTTRYDVAIADLHVADLDVRALLHGTAARAASIDIATVDADILLDKRLPSGSRRRPLLPHQAFQQIERDVSVDSVRLAAATIRYRETSADGVRPGSLTFDGVEVDLLNLNNDPSRMSADRPAVLNANGRIGGQGPLAIILRLPLLSRTLDFEFEGTMGPMHVPAINTMLEDLDGISIRSGEVHGVSFRGTTTAGTSRGTLSARYEDLSIAMVDKDDGDQPVGKWIQSFIANTFVVRGSNLPEEGELPNHGEIAHTREPNDPFFAFFWATLRSGILSQIGM
jgi:hypothetical protein